MSQNNLLAKLKSQENMCALHKLKEDMMPNYDINDHVFNNIFGIDSYVYII